MGNHIRKAYSGCASTLPADGRMKCSPLAILLLLTMICGAARAEERLPPIPASQYTREQQQAVTEFQETRKTPVFGPFEILLYSPRVMSPARAMGDYLRYQSAIGNTLSELVILMTAHEWRQEYEWSLHYPIALKAGVHKEVADAIAAGRRPTSMRADEKTVFDFTQELLRKKRVSEATFASAKSRLGKQGVVDMTAIIGYYTFLALQLNVAQYPTASAGAKPPPVRR